MAEPIDLTPKAPIVSYENEILVEVPSSFSDFFGGQTLNTPTVVRQNHIESSNFVTGVSGWRLDAEGNFEGNAGTFRGDLEAGSINIPNSTTPLFSVDSAGNVTMKSFSLVQTFTAGENLTVGRLACTLNALTSWGDEDGNETSSALIAKDTQLSLADFVYVDSTAPTTNYDPASICLLGAHNGAGTAKKVVGKFNLTDSDPGLPAWHQIEKVLFRVYVISTGTGGGGVSFQALNASFDESTVTWNTVPALHDSADVVSGVAVAFNGETAAASADGDASGYFEFDITDIYRLWSASKVTNNGFMLTSGVGEGNFTIGGKTRAGGGGYNQAPFLIFTVIKDNPGSGVILAASDGKAYHADSTDYQGVKNLLGIVGATTTTDDDVDVYMLADGTVVPSSILSVNAGRIYYLNDNAGGISALENDIIRSDEYTIKIGIGTADGLKIGVDKSMTYIKTSGFTETSGMLPPPGARFAYISYRVTYKTLYQLRGNIMIDKQGVTTKVDRLDHLIGTEEEVLVSFSWAAGTSGLLTASLSATSGIDSSSLSVDWYR